MADMAFRKRRKAQGDPSTLPEAAESADTLSRRQEILDAAAHLFSTQGFAATTIRQIAERCGIESGSLYYHFRSKNDLLQEILTFAITITSDNVRASVEALPEGSSARTRVETALWAHLCSLHDHIEYTSSNIRFKTQVPLAVQASVQDMRRDYANFWHQLLSEADCEDAFSGDVNVSLLRSLILGMLNHTVEWYDSRRGNIDELFTNIKVMISGIWLR